MPQLKLNYFDFHGGRAEPVRLALHIGGIAFEDHRFTFPEFAEFRKTTPFGQVPTLEDIAALLGLSPATLKGYHQRPRTDRSIVQRGVPYTVLYGLEVLASCPAGTALAIWGPR